MNRVVRFALSLACASTVGMGLARAEQPRAVEPTQPASAEPAMDPAKQAAMEAMQKLGSPTEGHKVFEPLVGQWTYTAQWWMAPEAPPESMTGTSTNSLIFGGRFLQQQVRGQGEGQPPFEGLGVLGYDNIRKEYQSLWLDNMATGMMNGTGQFDAPTSTLTEQGEFSCPMTGEAHRPFRSVWKLVDQDHSLYESYSRAPDGREFKTLELRYTRAQ